MNANDFSKEQNIELLNIYKNIFRMSFERKLSHIGSCVTAAPLIYMILGSKKNTDPFILSSGHAGLALYCVLEELKKEKGLAEKLFDKHGVHPSRDIENDIWASSGSLGHGIGIGIGYALSNSSITPYILISDGECSEGSIFEALRVAKEADIWMNVFINYNGFGAYKSIDKEQLSDMFYAYHSKTKKLIVDLTENGIEDLPQWLKGLEAHYHVMNEKEYMDILQALNGEYEFN